MIFFDSNLIYGIALSSKIYSLVPNIGKAQEEMSRAGIKYALIRREEQRDVHPQEANDILSEDLAHHDNVWGIWSVIPEYTKEMQGPEGMLEAMKKNKIVAWQFLPEHHGFTLHPTPLASWLTLAEKQRIPIFVEMQAGFTYEKLYDILERYPALHVILSHQSVRPSDRLIRPFLVEFENVYIELSYYMQSGGLEDLVETYGSSRLLFGTGFHRSYTGGAMLMLKHAVISEKDKNAIGYENMLRLVEGVSYDQ